MIQNSTAACLLIQATLTPVGKLKRFQPAGFPEIGQVTYEDGNDTVCIIDSAASMANHLETVCLDDPSSATLHPDLKGLPHVACVTEDGGKTRTVLTTLTEGHRLASEYFIGTKSTLNGQPFRDVLNQEMGLKKLSEKKFFFYPESWGDIYRTVFEYDPNSLVHGILFAREGIKISRLLSAHHEAHDAKRVSSSGVKFDRIGKTLSGQPIFSVTQQTGNIVATFVIDLALLRSYGRKGQGLTDARKQLLLELALWKIQRLTSQPFRFRSGCYLQTTAVSAHLDREPISVPAVSIAAAIAAADFPADRSPLGVFYPAADLYRQEDANKGKGGTSASTGGDESDEDDAGEES
ncbi:MAG: type I-U CRISPR-associated RAMP protein Csb1/Cas7u [Bryobacteraceae bacterium]|nr:type I-U CRISPR-associated RAMP protein Csb1/Cas7u [Bryobacteraceae bacterium]